MLTTEQTLPLASTTPSKRALHPRTRSRWVAANVVVGSIVLAGAGLLAYPSLAGWFSDVAHASTVSGYARQVADATSAEREALLDGAREYNQSLPDGPLRDPYILSEEGGTAAVEEGRESYLSRLSLTPDSPMARIRIPAIGVDLPVYHGTEERTLARGIGHLYGSGLPVGGDGTHAVLTGHSGIPESTLFTDLDRLRIGDAFMVDVAGETLLYRVDQIEVVPPDDGDLLRQAPGHDYVTLLTCTPTGVNTHRLLVRGERVDDGDPAADEIALQAPPAAPAVPWGATGILAGGLALAYLIARPKKSAEPITAALADSAETEILDGALVDRPQRVAPVGASHTREEGHTIRPEGDGGEAQGHSVFVVHHLFETEQGAAGDHAQPLTDRLVREHRADEEL